MPQGASSRRARSQRAETATVPGVLRRHPKIVVFAKGQRLKKADLLMRVAELEATLDRLTRVRHVSEYDGVSPAQWYAMIPNKTTGEMEAASVGMFTGNTFPTLEWFVYIPEIEGLPCLAKQTPQQGQYIPEKKHSWGRPTQKPKLPQLGP